MNFKLSYKFYLLIKSIIWIWYAFFFLTVVNGNNDKEVKYGVFLCAVLIQMTLITFINHWYKNKRPRLLDWFRLTTFFVIIFNFLVLIKDLRHQNNFFGFIIKSEFILPTLFVILIGLLGLKVSEAVYPYLKPRSLKSLHSIKIYEIKNILFFYFFALALASIQIFLMLTGEVGFGTFQENTTSDYSFLFQIVFILSNLVLSLFAIFKYLYPNKKKAYNLVFITYFLIQIVYGFLSGMKESIITPFIILLIPYLFSGRKISKMYLILVFFSFIILYPINNNYREILIDFPNIKKQEALGIALAKTAEFSLSENANNGSESYSNRLSLFPYLVYSVEKESEWSYYKNLNRYIYMPVSWIIPRFMLPEKPKSETGAVLNEIIVGVNTNSVTVTTYGWAYYEGGFFYVFLLFLLFGLFINFFQYQLGFDNLLGMLLYIELLVIMLKVETDIYFLISGVLQTIIIYLIMIKILINQNNIYVND
jgi:hypothetical protein